MRRRYHLIKEVTCPQCQGQGFVESNDDLGIPKYDLEFIEAKIKEPEEVVDWAYERKVYLEEHFCECCQGKGYVIDEVDLETGYTIVREDY